MAKSNLNENVRQEICRRYLAGESSNAIACSMGTSKQPVLRALREAHVACRTTRRVTLWSGSPEEVAEVVRRYRSGESQTAIARHFKTRTNTIKDVLCQAGTPIKKSGRYHPILPMPEQRHEVAVRYRAGESMRAIARSLGCSVPTVAKALEELGVDRTLGRPPLWTEERLAWLADQRLTGRSQQSIADELGVGQPTVSQQLRSIGLDIPERGRERHGAWRGGRCLNDQGYVLVLATEDDKHYCTPWLTGYVLEHRLVMGRKLGRKLTRRETVHHVNGNRSDNRPENLQLQRGRRGNGVRYVCLDCGSHNVETVDL